MSLLRRLLKPTLWILGGLAAVALVLSLWFQPQRAAGGTWMSAGYGFAIDIGRLRTTVYEVSAIHCSAP